MQGDLLLLSGGISVGEYDFAGRVLAEAGVETVFYRVSQKPGKPLFFGATETCRVFALPGNPASALVCYWVYARSALRRMAGRRDPELEPRRCRLAHDLDKPFPRACFERALVEGGQVRSLDGQESFHLRSLALANALLALPEGPGNWKEGEEVDVLLVP